VKNGMEASVCFPVEPSLVKENELIEMVTRLAKGNSFSLFFFSFSKQK
jgi:hypothetical protein